MWSELVCALLVVHVFSLAALQEPEPLPIPADGEATVCDLEERLDADPLNEAEYWSVLFAYEHQDKCPVPPGYESRHVSSCYLHFAACGRVLPWDICRGHTNASSCQEVVTRDGRRHYYGSHGNNSPQSSVQSPIGYKSSDRSFTIRQQNNPLTVRLCNGHYTISVKFVCDLSMKWDPHSHDASSFVIKIELNHDSCKLEITFGYSGACLASPTLTPAQDVNCILPPYNLTGLKSRPFWFAKVESHFCYGSDVLACVFYFAFCQALPAHQQKVNSSCHGSSICQSGLVDGVSYPVEFAYRMGTYEGYTRFYFNGKASGGGFYMEVTNGTIPGCGSKTKTRVVLTCNSSVEWLSEDLTNIVQVKEKSSCEYEITLPYKGACLPVFPNATLLPSTSPAATTVAPTMTSSATPPAINTSTIHHNYTSTTNAHITSSFTLITVNASTVHSTSTQHSTTTPTSTATPTSTIPGPTTTSAATNTSSLTTPTSTATPISTIPRHTTTSAGTNTPSLTTPTSTLPTTSTNSPSSNQVATETTFLVSSYATMLPIVSPVPSRHPGNKDGVIITSLAVGVALFGVLTVVLLVAIVVTSRILTKKNRKLKFINSSE